jgi:hypothetical protein
MERFLEFVQIVVALGAIAVGVVFIAGALIAPAVIIVQVACWWRRRLKWAAVALVTSWLGLWLFQRGEARRSHGPSARSAARLA